MGNKMTYHTADNQCPSNVKNNQDHLIFERQLIMELHASGVKVFFQWIELQSLDCQALKGV